MKQKLLTLVFLFSLGLLSGCYPGGAEYDSDLDVVLSGYDDKFDFQSKGTYSIPDKIVKVTGEEGEPEYINDIYATPMLQQIEKNMTAYGWTKVESTASPDIQILPAAWSTTTVYSYGYWGDYYCYWDPYYCGGGWYYPYYPYYTSYSTGTLVILAVDPNSINVDDSRTVVWTGAVNGLLSGTYNVDRIYNGIDQTFTQSPYLNTK